MRTVFHASQARFTWPLAMLIVLGAGLPVQAQFDLPGLGGGLNADAGPPKVTVSARFSTPTPERTATLHIKADIVEGFHVYSVTQGKLSGIGPEKTRFKLDESSDYRLVGEFQPDAPPKKHVDKEAFIGLTLEEHYGSVTWSAPIELAANVDPREIEVRGAMLTQVCDPRSCRPMNIPFSGRLDPALQTGVAPAANSQSTPATGPVGAGGASLGGSLLVNFATGFLGGLILNLMPCVLPVIGLKIMSFLEQAGHSRSRALMLNIWYSVGVISIFLVIATMAMAYEMPVGSQFGSDTFNIVLTAIVFAMGLSLLGVWEIPIPGFVGGRRAHSLAEKEGPAGALTKGVLTTILATPCIGPFLGPALGWAVSQPPSTAYTVFFAAGLGMASPYLLIGAFPRLMHWVPKPGAWMGTFKQIMGFVLLGTVIFLLTFIHPTLIVPTMALLAGIGAACWWISRTPLTAELPEKLRAWVVGVAVTALVGVFSFQYLQPIMEHRFNNYVALAADDVGRHVEGELHWQPFTRERLEQLTAQGKTVLVDFTADWCMVCKSLEAMVLNTPQVVGFVEQNDVVALKADFTKTPPEITAMLKELSAAGVPVLAIYPAGGAQAPIVFRAPYTIGDVLAALEKAGPSSTGAAASTAAVTTVR